MGIHPYVSGGLIIPMNNIQIIKDPFGIPIWATIFTFQIYLHTFSHTFLLIRISKNYKKTTKISSQTTLSNTP